MSPPNRIRKVENNTCFSTRCVVCEVRAELVRAAGPGAELDCKHEQSLAEQDCVTLEKKDEEAALLRQAEEDEAREAKRAANRAKQKAKAESRRKRPT